VLEQGVDAEVDFVTSVLARGTPGGTFVDFAPMHVITTATLAAVGVEALRYRPSLVIESDGPPFAENDWAGREIAIGDVRLRGLVPTPRCAVPTLEHGELPRAPHAVRALLDTNRVDVLDMGPQPCAGVYAEVLTPGTVRLGDALRA
jgi:uncharacterized protein YcbX